MINVINKISIKLNKKDFNFKMNIFHKLIKKKTKANHYYYKSNNQNNNLLNNKKKNYHLIKLSKTKNKIT